MMKLCRPQTAAVNGVLNNRSSNSTWDFSYRHKPQLAHSGFVT
jgi:hypothetical protein